MSDDIPQHPLLPTEEQLEHRMENGVVYPTGRPCEAIPADEYPDEWNDQWNTWTTEDRLPETCPHCGQEVSV